ncbi:MAG: beta-ketoacyl-[acyl-carrier-protein] synthase family protein [Planctomycetota bacterium]
MSTENRRRVVVTGMGWVTPFGDEIEKVWAKLLAGECAIDRITIFDTSTFPTQIAAEVHDFDLARYVQTAEWFAKAGRASRFLIGAASLAMKDAGLSRGDVDPERLGTYMGTGEGEMDFVNFGTMIGIPFDGTAVNIPGMLSWGMRLLDGIRELEQEPSVAGGHLAALFDARGPNLNCLTACAASSQAIGEATELIRRGSADAMLSGGTHSMIHPFGLAGFNLLGALSTRNDEPKKASRPFDRDRDGFVLGEGSGVVILEELEHARRRGARIHGEIVGYGSTGDAFRITDTHPEGRGGIAAMRAAIADAGAALEEVDYISAHGTSTNVNDKIETLAIREVFGQQAHKVPVSSIKGMLGHLIAAAGAVELITCLLAMRDSMLPPTINYETPDPECDLDYVPNRARKAQVRVALSNSFGFGGQNICLAAREYRED